MIGILYFIGIYRLNNTAVNKAKSNLVLFAPNFIRNVFYLEVEPMFLSEPFVFIVYHIFEYQKNKGLKSKASNNSCMINTADNNF